MRDLLLHKGTVIAYMIKVAFIRKILILRALYIIHHSRGAHLNITWRCEVATKKSYSMLNNNTIVCFFDKFKIQISKSKTNSNIKCQKLEMRFGTFEFVILKLFWI